MTIRSNSGGDVSSVSQSKLFLNVISINLVFYLGWNDGAMFITNEVKGVVLHSSQKDLTIMKMDLTHSA